jgi:hypothetical protein
MKKSTQLKAKIKNSALKKSLLSCVAKFHAGVPLVY